MKTFLTLLLIFTASVFAACQSVAPEKAEKAEIKQISVGRASDDTTKENVQFIDVRTDSEYKSGHAPKALNMPLDALDGELAKLDKEKPVYVICQTGRRSQTAAETLKKAGFTDVYNITGGTSAWTNANLPLEK
jgi:rhodanese-related sulfurtransferase